MSKPLSPAETAELNAVLQRAVDRMERRRRKGLATDHDAEQLANEVVDLRDELAVMG